MLRSCQKGSNFLFIINLVCAGDCFHARCGYIVMQLVTAEKENTIAFSSVSVRKLQFAYLLMLKKLDAHLLMLKKPLCKTIIHRVLYYSEYNVS